MNVNNQNPPRNLQPEKNYVTRMCSYAVHSGILDLLAFAPKCPNFTILAVLDFRAYLAFLG